ncbi:MAG: hypothetical protein Q9169_005921 [Polycauliona sp. 2 TL-2023]
MPLLDRDFLYLDSLVLKSLVNGSWIAPLIEKKDLLISGDASAPIAPKITSSFTTPAPHASRKGLPHKDTATILKSILKTTPKYTTKTRTKPVKNETPKSNLTVAPQASTEESPHTNAKVTEMSGTKLGSASAESTSPSGPNSTDVPAPPITLQSNGTAGGLSQEIKALLDGQRTDIDRIAANVDDLMRDIKTLTASLDYLKFQQKTFAEHETAQSPTALTEEVRILTREQQLLTESVEKLQRRPTEVEKLKEELESLKQRIHCMEDTIQSERQKTSGPMDSGTWASRPKTEARQSSHAPSDSMNDAQKMPKNRSPSLVGPLSAQASISRRTSDYSLPTDMIMNDDEHLYFATPTPTEDMILDHRFSEAEEPQITSASKVATQNRRRLSDSSSNTGPPRKKRGRQPNSKGKPDWTTKPLRLKNHQAVLASDPEDDDYDPDKNTQERQEVRMNSRPSRPGVFRMPTPEWEKPDWEGPSVAPLTDNARGRTTARRGVSGRAPLIDRDAAARRRSAGYGNSDYVYPDSPQYWGDEQSPTNGVQTDMRQYDPYDKPRDSEGRLIRQNGKVDGRSLRHIRAREEKARQAAVQQQLRMTSQDSKHVTEGQQKELQAMGLMAPGARPGLVDAAALEAARTAAAANSATSIPTHQLAATNKTIPQDAIENGGYDGGGPSTTTGVTAPQTQTQTDKHDALMKSVFPWR